MVHMTVGIDDVLNSQVVFFSQCDDVIDPGCRVDHQRVTRGGITHQIGKHSHMAHLHLLQKHRTFSVRS